MTSTNGHGPKRVILYARVSTDEQAHSGYSLAQQIEALREYAAREGYKVLEEIVDPGQSGVRIPEPALRRGEKQDLPDAEARDHSATGRDPRRSRHPERQSQRPSGE